MAHELGLEERIIFTGAIPHDEVPHYTAAADMFVFSSLTDTQGLVLMEAMAAGTPVVAVEAPGPVDVLAEGGGILVPSQEDAFAETVCALLTDEDRLREMGEEAKRAVKRYSISEATQRLLAVYEAAID
jgi:1,2-diacylglycerol 3-alpha-glucosyltransferase